MKIDPRVTLALIAALMLQTAGGLIWAGRAAARLEAVERSLAAQADVNVRLARMEEQLSEARRALARIETRLERQ